MSAPAGELPVRVLNMQLDGAEQRARLAEGELIMARLAHSKELVAYESVHRSDRDAWAVEREALLHQCDALQAAWDDQRAAMQADFEKAQRQWAFSQELLRRQSARWRKTAEILATRFNLHGSGCLGDADLQSIADAGSESFADSDSFLLPGPDAISSPGVEASASSVAESIAEPGPEPADAGPIAAVPSPQFKSASASMSEAGPGLEPVSAMPVMASGLTDGKRARRAARPSPSAFAAVTLASFMAAPSSALAVSLAAPHAPRKSAATAATVIVRFFNIMYSPGFLLSVQDL